MKTIKNIFKGVLNFIFKLFGYDHAKEVAKTEAVQKQAEEDIVAVRAATVLAEKDAAEKILAMQAKEEEAKQHQLSMEIIAIARAKGYPIHEVATARANADQAELERIKQEMEAGTYMPSTTIPLNREQRREAMRMSGRSKNATKGSSLNIPKGMRPAH